MAPSESQSKGFENPFLSLISKIPLGFLNQGAKAGLSVKEEPTVEVKAGEGQGEDSITPVKPNIVTFNSTLPEIQTLKLQSEAAEQDSNPIVLWEVYILGGFILLKWGWSKWQERQANAKKKDSTDDQPQPKD